MRQILKKHAQPATVRLVHAILGVQPKHPVAERMPQRFVPRRREAIDPGERKHASYWTPKETNGKTPFAV